MSKSKLLTFLLIFLSFSAIFSFYNFDSASAYTGTITYDAGTNTITCVGGSSSTPITFEDIYQADLGGSWGNIEKLSPYQYSISAKLVFGNSDTYTYFKDTMKQIQFNFNTSYSYGFSYLTIGENCTFQLGEVINEILKTTRNGVDIIFYNRDGWNSNILVDTNDTSIVNIYSSTFNALRYDTLGFGSCQVIFLGCFDRIWNTKIYMGCINTQYRDVQLDIYNVEGIWGRGDGLFRAMNQIITINRLYCINTINILRSDMGGNLCLYNVYARNITYVISCSNFPNGNTTFVDADIDNWNFLWLKPNADNKGFCFRKYSFNLNVLNGEITDFVQNANVTLYKDNVKVYSGLTNSSGMIPTQTLTLGYYRYEFGNEIQDSTIPYYLVITHPDWQTYISRFYITEPLRLTVSMQEPTYPGYTEVEKSDYTTIILFVISLILCIIGLALTVPLLPLISLTISVLNIIFLSEPSIFNILLIVLNVTFTLIALVRAKTKNN